MGSSEVFVLATDTRLHVMRDSAGWWWAVGHEGSYGGSPKRDDAIRYAIDASATGCYWPGPGTTALHPGARRIVVYDETGRVACTLLRVKVRATPQWFQDVVP